MHRSGKAAPLGEKRITSSLKCNCPFRIRIENCIDGWVIVGGHFEHNGHDLIKGTGQVWVMPLSFYPSRIIRPWKNTEACWVFFFKDQPRFRERSIQAGFTYNFELS